MRCNILGNYRKVDEEKFVEAVHGEDTTGVSKQVNTTKKLVDSKELTPCFRVQYKAKQMLRSLAIPAHRVFGESTYLIPILAVQRAEDELKAFEGELRHEASELRKRWPGAMARQKLAIGDLFDARQYPTPEQVEQAWSLEWHYVSFAAPERLETVNTALFESARNKYEQRMADAYDEVRLVLRETLRQVTNDIAKKLTPGPDGKPKVFRNTVLEDLTQFLSTFDIRNIADDAELAGVVTQLRKLTSGVDAEALRDADALRASVLAGVKKATNKLDRLVEKSRGRAITFGAIDLD